MKSWTGLEATKVDATRRVASDRRSMNFIMYSKCVVFLLCGVEVRCKGRIGERVLVRDRSGMERTKKKNEKRKEKRE